MSGLGGDFCRPLKRHRHRNTRTSVIYQACRGCRSCTMLGHPGNPTRTLAHCFGSCGAHGRRPSVCRTGFRCARACGHTSDRIPAIRRRPRGVHQGSGYPSRGIRASASGQDSQRSCSARTTSRGLASNAPSSSIRNIFQPRCGLATCITGRADLSEAICGVQSPHGSARLKTANSFRSSTSGARIQYLQRRFLDVRSDHFRAFFETASDEPLAREVVERLEAAYWRVGGALGVYPPRPDCSRSLHARAVQQRHEAGRVVGGRVRRTDSRAARRVAAARRVERIFHTSSFTP